MPFIGAIGLGAALLLPLAVIIGRRRNARASRIPGADGLQQEAYLNIGGIAQYVQIRGQHRPIRDGGHIPFLDRPQACVEALRQALGQALAASGAQS